MKLSQPTISICTPTYNRPRHLELLFRCILDQDYPLSLIQWLILDDSDRPIPPKFLNNAPLEIVYKKLKKKTPLGQKRNKLNAMSKGEILIYMDDDDYYPPSRISHAVDTLLTSDCKIAGSSLLPIFYLDRSELYTLGPIDVNHGTAGTFAVRKSFTCSKRFDKTKTIAEESDFLDELRIPMAQLDPYKTILCMAHSSNTADKHQLIGAHPKLRKVQAGDNELMKLLFPNLNIKDYQRVNDYLV